MSRAVEQSNVPALNKVLHPQFQVHVTGGPFIPKDSLLLSFSNSGGKYSSFRPKTETFIVLDKNTIITSGKESFQHKDGKFADKEHHREFYHVWLTDQGKWRLAGRYVAIID